MSVQQKIRTSKYMIVITTLPVKMCTVLLAVPVIRVTMVMVGSAQMSMSVSPVMFVQTLLTAITHLAALYAAVRKVTRRLMVVKEDLHA